MRTQAEQALRGWWRGEGGAAGAVLQALAAPAEWAYRCGLAVRNRTYDRRGGVSLDGLRVVSVGNLVLGGTGKTPLAAWAARALLSAGWRVALVSRGYGRDEILLHRRWSPDIPVIADPDRVAGATAAQGGGADAVVLDDAFQHRRLARDVDLVLLAAEDPLEGRLLPRGPFREPLAALSRAHGVVVTRRTADAADAGALAERVAALFPELRVARAALVPDGWQHLDGTPAPPPEGPTLAVTAVARPELFSAQVAAATGGPAELMAFADHHEFVSSDVEAMRARARQRTLVVTEKDAVKLHPHQGALEPVRVLAQALRWEAGEAEL
ncbi:MAG: tetraacyldisaccharide 4'-kinase, partial [Gemmatimonadetes bacterium]|nr:tetraacyldisaccharide 4'-kinase [Gemmatimonadota bacterium]